MHKELIRRYGLYQWLRYVIIGLLRPFLRLIPGIYTVDGWVIRPRKEEIK